jgi:tetratricopeptide (TPR) repeat protein
MVYDASDDFAGSDPATRAAALMDRAISEIQAGEHDAAIADLQEAERIASEAGTPELITAVKINQGYAHSVNGDADSAIRCYREAAEIARGSGDTVRLQLALANLSAQLDEQAQHTELRATLDEYLLLLDEDQVEARVRALITRGLSHLDSGDEASALADLQEADEIANQADEDSLIYFTQISLGDAYNRTEDPQSALMLYDRATMIARQLEDTFALRDVLVRLSQTNHSVGHNHLARHQFIELEGLCRQTDDPAHLAHALYWFGSNLQSLGRAQEALTKWTEAASIRRELGHEGHLADCLLVMADTHRRRGQHDQADPLYSEAEEIYTRLGAEDVLGSTIYWHGMSLWSGGKPQEALPLVEEALRLATEEGNDEFECRSRGLHAMVLADLEDLSAAGEELDLAEARCNETGLHNLAVWMLARRAYLYARENREITEVAQELSKAFVYAVDHNEMDAATSAIRRVSSLISSRCAEEYREPVQTLKDQLLSSPVDPITGTGMPDLPLDPTAGEDLAPEAGLPTEPDGEHAADE